MGAPSLEGARISPAANPLEDGAALFLEHVKQSKAILLNAEELADFLRPVRRRLENWLLPRIETLYPNLPVALHNLMPFELLTPAGARVADDRVDLLLAIRNRDTGEFVLSRFASRSDPLLLKTPVFCGYVVTIAVTIENGPQLARVRPLLPPAVVEEELQRFGRGDLTGLYADLITGMLSRPRPLQQGSISRVEQSADTVAQRPTFLVTDSQETIHVVLPLEMKLHSLFHPKVRPPSFVRFIKHDTESLRRAFQRLHYTNDYAILGVERNQPWLPALQARVTGYLQNIFGEKWEAGFESKIISAAVSQRDENLRLLVGVSREARENETPVKRYFLPAPRGSDVLQFIDFAGLVIEAEGHNPAATDARTRWRLARLGEPVRLPSVDIPGALINFYPTGISGLCLTQADFEDQILKMLKPSSPTVFDNLVRSTVSADLKKRGIEATEIKLIRTLATVVNYPGLVRALETSDSDPGRLHAGYLLLVQHNYGQHLMQLYRDLWTGIVDLRESAWVEHYFPSAGGSGSSAP
jgi:hypothetical protein